MGELEPWILRRFILKGNVCEAKKYGAPFRYLGFFMVMIYHLVKSEGKKNNLKLLTLAISDPEIKPFERLIFSLNM